MQGLWWSGGTLWGADSVYEVLTESDTVGGFGTRATEQLWTGQTQSVINSLISPPLHISYWPQPQEDRSFLLLNMSDFSLSFLDVMFEHIPHSQSSILMWIIVCMHVCVIMIWSGSDGPKIGLIFKWKKILNIFFLLIMVWKNAFLRFMQNT